MSTQYRVVGHRGFPHKFPENSLKGLVEAAKAGAHCVELDVQISRDNIPVVFHDDTIDRVTGQSGFIWEYSEAELKNISCHEPQRFSHLHFPTPISSLESVCEALSSFDVHIFVEIKEQALTRVDRSTMLEKVMHAIRCVKPCVTLISFDFDILTLAKSQLPVGWVLREMDHLHRGRAETLQPQVLAYDVKRLQAKQLLWQGDWKWFLYDIVDPREAQLWADNGVEYIETWNVRALL